MIPVQFATAINRIEAELKTERFNAIGYITLSILFLTLSIYSMCNGIDVSKYIGISTNAFCSIYFLIRACLVRERIYNLNLMLEMMHANEKENNK